MLNDIQASYVQRGEAIDHTNAGSSEIKANDVVSLSSRIGVAGCKIPVGAVGSVHVIGVFDLPSVTTEAFTVGQEVYWNGTAVTATAAGSVPAGWVVEPKATAKATARVKIG